MDMPFEGLGLHPLLVKAIRTDFCLPGTPEAYIHRVDTKRPDRAKRFQKKEGEEKSGNHRANIRSGSAYPGLGTKSARSAERERRDNKDTCSGRFQTRPLPCRQRLKAFVDVVGHRFTLTDKKHPGILAARWTF